MSTKNSTAKQQKHLNDLVRRCSIFTGHCGRISSVSYPKKRPSTLINLGMTYEGRGLIIDFFTTTRRPHSRGTCKVMVRKKKRLVLEASGNFVGFTYKITAQTYIPGNWEKRIRVLPRMK